MNELVTEQRDPAPNDKPAVWDLVQEDMAARDREGRRKYGTPLQPHNGRSMLTDLYQELLDATVYTRAEIEERRWMRSELERIYKLCWDHTQGEEDGYRKIADILTTIFLRTKAP